MKGLIKGSLVFHGAIAVVKVFTLNTLRVVQYYSSCHVRKKLQNYQQPSLMDQEMNSQQPRSLFENITTSASTKAEGMALVIFLTA